MKKSLLRKPHIVKIGNPVLRGKTCPVPLRLLRDGKFQTLLAQMVETMRKAQGVGLAANQMGWKVRVFVMECRANPRYPKAAFFPLQVYVNPRILRYSRAVEKGWEGCLSIPGYRGLVPRAKRVTMEAMRPDGRKVRKTFRRFEARVVQHEVDHLNGRFYVDRMKSLKCWMHLEEFNRTASVRVRDGR